MERLNRLYARRLIDLEITQGLGDVYKRDASPDEIKLIDYCMSTPFRRMFSMLCVRADMDNIPLLPSDAAKELGTTRNTIDTLISELDAYNYIDILRDERGHRSVTATKFMTDVYIKYSDALANLALELDFAGINTARKYAE